MKKAIAPQLVDKGPKESKLQGFASLCSVFAVALFVMGFVFQNFVIPTSSMASTLMVGDHVIVERSNLAPAADWAPFARYREVRRGDIIVFYKPPAEPSGEHIYLVKRVIGVPGDRIHLHNGVVYLNGIPQDEPLAAKPTLANYLPYAREFPSVPPSERYEVTAEWAVTMSSDIHDGELVVPPGKYFAMGDNRANSLDSRFWGFVPRENIVGRPLMVYWSVEMAENGELNQPLSEQASSTMHTALHFFDKTRWRRTFHLVERCRK
jgi:signal peptidase I